ncbi:DUF1638 domain-containing protein [Anaeromyxobacter paludicola]|uniref:DUF1638 domain-containing protein n=1 Tax=Anaeromyxobacter paludicola TaxID=2918171 RepID=A0ABM7XAE8_9BACT|nr:DUF1638 domain-containing protein [Anaeromyxobacter paludicola]BDG08827.1 hypothetical protein AMPC_19400 [Anaeromyxobacter paludicola]
MSAPATMLVTCSVYEREVEALRQVRWPWAVHRRVSSMLHMRPQKLERHLAAALDDARAGSRVVLVYGDCCPAMASLEGRPGVARTRALNCCELLLGADAYRQLSREGAFFLLHEWAERWPEVFQQELGLDLAQARELMTDLHRKLVYLDTGLAPVPEAVLAACAAFAGLPCEVRPTPLDHLAGRIDDALRRLGAGEAA